MKTGRNEPCPCGSGKKYKQCCLNKEKPPVDLLWYRLNSAHDSLIEKLMAFAEERIGAMALMFAIGEFLLWPEEDEDIYDLIDDHMQLFLSWYLFNWLYDPHDGEEADVQVNIDPDLTIAETYLAEHGNRLDELEVRLIKATVHKPYSFLEVVACEPGNSLTMKDVLTGEKIRVIEETASEMVQIGDILLGRTVTVGHVSMILGLSSIAIRPSFKSHIISLRNQIQKVEGPITRKELEIHSYDIRDLYLYLYQLMVEPPDLTNTDGDPIMFHTLQFSIDSPHDVFEKLQRLSGGMPLPDEMLQEPEYDANGRIVTAALPWVQESDAGENVIIGKFAIERGALYAEVNSAARADRIRNEIEACLGDSAKFIETRTHDMVFPWPEDDEDEIDHEQFQEDLDAMAEDPQALAYLQQIIRDHWHGWVDEKLPALNGRTPRQAAKTEDGREAIEAMLLEARRPLMHDGMLDKFETDPLEDVRRRLGLHKPLKGKGGQDDLEHQQQAFKTIDALISDTATAFLDSRLVMMSRHLCRRLAAGEEFALDRGRPENWAAAIVYVVAEINLLFDPESEQPLTKEAVFTAFDVKARTITDKAGQIKTACNIGVADPRFTLPELAARFNLDEDDDFIRAADTDGDVPIPGGAPQKEKPRLRAVPLRPRKDHAPTPDEDD